MTTPSPIHKSIARAAAAAFGGGPRVDRYWDDAHEASVDILTCVDSPWEGVTSYATIGVSEIPLVKDGKELAVRTELVGACGSQFDKFAKYLATAAFCIVKQRRFVAPDVVIPDVLSMYDPLANARHLLFVPPFLWDGRLVGIDVGTRRVEWLLAVPISDGELQMAESKSVAALREIFEERQIDIFDLRRPSVV